jgi:hypothetical protein
VARRWQQPGRRAVAARAHVRGEGRKSSVKMCGVNCGGEAPLIGPREGHRGGSGVTPQKVTW